QISTKVLKAPTHSIRCTSCGAGHGSLLVGVPFLRTTYVPMRPVKNMISVAKKIHIANLAFGTGTPMCRTGSSYVAACAINFLNLPSLMTSIGHKQNQQYRQVNERGQKNGSRPLH